MKAKKQAPEISSGAFLLTHTTNLLTEWPIESNSIPIQNNCNADPNQIRQDIQAISIRKFSYCQQYGEN